VRESEIAADDRAARSRKVAAIEHMRRASAD
jgi:hypothetical protein